MVEKLDTETFIEKAKEVYGDKYGYDKVDYKNKQTKVIITCPIHGDFLTDPKNFLNGHSCKKCASEELSKNLRKSNEQFEKEAREIYGDKYDYSKVNYINQKTKVCIICPEHGEFWVIPDYHLRGGCGCKQCNQHYDKNDFVDKANKRYHGKYSYDKTIFDEKTKSITVTCPIHGDFRIKPSLHLGGKECPVCSKEKTIRKYTTEEFIELAKKKHGDRYDYSKVDYKGNTVEVCIICPEHGEFWQKPSSHLEGCDCPKCAGVHRYSTEEYIDLANKKHNGKYSYEKTVYARSHDKVIVTCPKHGDFLINASAHLYGSGCTLCRNERNGEVKRLSGDEFIDRARKVHGDKYDYSKVEYRAMYKNVCIICPEHGEFWMRPQVHLLGYGCKSCSQSIFETSMELMLISKNIIFEKQKHFKWLHKQSLDFYLPEYNAAIECQGIQHFETVRYFTPHNKTENEAFENIKRRDKEKLEKCAQNGVKIYYFSNLGIEYPYQVYENFDELIEAIKHDKKLDILPIQ